MKKMNLMAGILIASATIAGTSVTANAAMPQNVNIKSNRVKVIRIGQGCDLNSLVSQLQNCLPGISFPQFQQPDAENSCPEVPEVELPTPGLPSPELPEQETPSPELPELEIPTPESPEQEKPSPELPELEIPSPELPEQEKPSPEMPEQENLTYVEQVVQLVNVERAKEGLAPLKLNTKVSAAAQVRAKEIVASFSHTRPDGSSFATALKEQNISYRRAGENIAWGQKSPQEVVTAWMNSSGHRANIMNENFTSIGVGYHRQNGVNYWCQLFTS